MVETKVVILISWTQPSEKYRVYKDRILISTKIIIFSLNTNRGEQLSEQAMIGKRRRRLDTVADDLKILN